MAPTGTTNRMPRPLATPPLAEQQQADGDRIDHGVHESGRTQIGQQATAADDDGDASGEIHDAGPEEQFRPIAAEPIGVVRRSRHTAA